ncbi:condensation domain-containing protein [Paenibacillus illinoisensis]|uniref:condensation domain-containing protein n=1 Tax=Paenibacillus illinoisensis TaxID=59845 RepID=UPI0030162EEB
MENKTSECSTEESVAIIGMGCRLPGEIQDPEAFWRILSNKKDLVTPVPENREELSDLSHLTSQSSNHIYSHQGAFIKEIDHFDSSFFGISPREAASIDPQHRMLLEVAYEALERAGQPLEKVRGSLTGVFVGISSSDYLQLQLQDINSINSYSGTGSMPGFAAGRLSYFLDLRGPSFSIDTTCSSSLVAVHQACQSLKLRESNMALAGGVNLILAPFGSVIASSLQALSPDGRCKTFDASANGFVRGEGCGMVVLKRLSDAVADHDPILAVIRGSAVNQDGRSTNLTAPNGLAQQAVIRQALNQAGLHPDQINYIETHGTGTLLGDPIEFEAIRQVFSVNSKRETACVLGAVKTNIGHLEAAAGIASLIKVVLSLNHEEIPPNLHFKDLNPYLTLNPAHFILPDTLQKWTDTKGKRYAGISSFGMSGTNAHLVVGSAPITKKQVKNPERTWVFPISAHSSTSLKSYMKKLSDFLHNQPEIDLADLSYTLSSRRSTFDYRVILVANSINDLIAKLDKEMVKGIEKPVAPINQKKPLVFIFSGQGTHWLGMGRNLFEGEPVFRETLEKCNQLFILYSGWSLIEELFAEERDSKFHQTSVIQPIIFSIQAALLSLWESWGITPDAVVGHSAGEIAAAFSAGVLDLNDALKLVFYRSMIMEQIAGQGSMAALELPIEETEKFLTEYNGELNIAAHNSPSLVVVSGDSESVSNAVEKLLSQGRYAKKLGINYAFHSPQLKPYGEQLREIAQKLKMNAPKISFYSTVTASRVTADELDASYWVRNMIEPVLFTQTVDRLVEDGVEIFLEVSPDEVLTKSLRQYTMSKKVNIDILPSVNRHQDDYRTLMKSLSVLINNGRQVHWAKLYPNGTKVIELPSYAWEHRNYWLSNLSKKVHIKQPDQSVSSQFLEEDRTVTLDQLSKSEQMIEILNPKEEEPFVMSFLEEKIGSILEVEHIEEVVHKPLNQIGLDSLLAVEIRNAVEERFPQTKPPVSFILGGASIQDIGSFIIENMSNAESTPHEDTSGIKENNIKQSELSYGQQALWFINQFDPSDMSYTMFSVFKICSKLDEQALKNSIEHLVKRHEILRTTYQEGLDGPIQIIHSESESIKFSYLKRDNLIGETHDVIKHKLEAAVETPFELNKGPLIRFYLYDLNKNEFLMLITSHHIAIDFWSFNILFDELTKIYDTQKQNQDHDLSEVTVSYIDYVKRHSKLLSGSEGEGLSLYWMDALEGELPVLELPTDYPRPKMQTSNGNTISIQLDQGLDRNIREFSADNGISLYSFLLANFNLLLYHLTEANDIIIGSPMAGMRTNEFRNLVGYLSNVVPIRNTIINKDITFMNFLNQVQRNVLEAVDHQELPLSHLMKNLKVKRDLSRPLLFSVLFVMEESQLPNLGDLALLLQGAKNVKSTIGNLKLESYYFKSNRSQYDLTLTVNKGKSGISLDFNYNTDLFTEVTITKWSHKYLELLNNTIINPSKIIGKLV